MHITRKQAYLKNVYAVGCQPCNILGKVNYGDNKKKNQRLPESRGQEER